MRLQPVKRESSLNSETVRPVLGGYVLCKSRSPQICSDVGIGVGVGVYVVVVKVDDVAVEVDVVPVKVDVGTPVPKFSRKRQTLFERSIISSQNFLSSNRSKLTKFPTW